MKTNFDELPRKLEITDPGSFHINVLKSHGLESLIKLSQSQGIPDFISWDPNTNLFKIAIPFPELDKSIAKTHLNIAKNHKLAAEIKEVQLTSGKTVNILYIADTINPIYGYYSAYDLANGLDKQSALISIVSDAYNALYDIKPMSETLAPVNILTNMECIEFQGTRDFSEITASPNALLYSTGKRASLAIPLDLVDEDIQTEIKDIFTGLALKYGGRSGKMECETADGNNAIYSIVQIPMENYQELKAFAVHLGLNPQFQKAQ